MSGSVPMPWWAKTVEARPPKAERFSLMPATARTFRPRPPCDSGSGTSAMKNPEVRGLAEERQDDLLVALLDPIEVRGHLLRRELLDGPHQQAFLCPHVVRNDDFVR